ncbi:hypothetical protein MKX01_018886 [Papaver californicum]|nr:hypothetical protein MKX01_018886 [Papaver californicum]
MGGRVYTMACCCRSPPPPPPSPPPPSPPPPPPPSPPPPPPSPSPPPPPLPSPADPCPSLEKTCKVEETYVEFHVLNTSKCSLCRSGCRKKCQSMDSTVAKQMCLNEYESTTLFCTCCCKENTPTSVSTGGRFTPSRSRVDYM